MKKNTTFPIGIDICDDSLRLVQLGNNGKGMHIIAGASERKPDDITSGSSTWQRWAIETIQKQISSNNFQGKEVIAGIPTTDVFIDHMKMPRVDQNKLEETLFSKIKQKLPFEADLNGTVLKYIPTEQDNVIVIAAERIKIDRHLAIYEKVGTPIKSIGIWPSALVKCYTTFFGRRKSDFSSVVMLICIEENSTNVTICRHKNLLFARSIPIGAQQLEDETEINRLVFELTACKRQFTAIYNNTQIERLIFLSSRNSDRNACASIAKQMEMPAQIGDCLAAVEIASSLRQEGNSEREKEKEPGNTIDRRNCRINWAVAFGMSLS
ncbi:MAG: pilus assembly protein PilM [Sedimentisphaerales bacterium]|nr:pilus assembly protein PilM [Sedimentisphaerales bacterium]